jgi:hypothetical protein
VEEPGDSGQETGEEERPPSPVEENSIIPICVIPRLEAIDQAEAPLHHALLVIVGGLHPPVSDHQVLEAVAASFTVDPTSLKVATTDSEDFIIFLPNEAMVNSLQWGLPAS